MTTPIIDLSEVEQEARNLEWSKRIAEVLEKHYPGYLWAVHADCHNGIAMVNALALSGEWGFYAKLADLDPGLKKIVNWGGELLERFKTRRRRADMDELHGLTRDHRGHKVVDRA